MKANRRIVYRLSLVATVALALVFAASFCASVQLTPHGVLWHGRLILDSGPRLIPRPWFEIRRPQNYNHWDGRLAPIFGADRWWLSSYVAVQTAMPAPGEEPPPLPTSPKSYSLMIPLIYPLLALASLAWFTRRARVRRGYCRCGYDLTGNVSGLCPECGASLLEGNR